MGRIGLTLNLAGMTLHCDRMNWLKLAEQEMWIHLDTTLSCSETNWDRVVADYFCKFFTVFVVVFFTDQIELLIVI